jgi:hypothetical protein
VRAATCLRVCLYAGILLRPIAGQTLPHELLTPVRKLSGEFMLHSPRHINCFFRGSQTRIVATYAQTGASNPKVVGSCRTGLGPAPEIILSPGPALPASSTILVTAWE